MGDKGHREKRGGDVGLIKELFDKLGFEFDNYFDPLCHVDIFFSICQSCLTSIYNLSVMTDPTDTDSIVL